MAIGFSATASSLPMSVSSVIKVNSDSMRMIEINNRLAVIQNMDLQHLSATDKQSLKSELISLKKETGKMSKHAGQQGLYISIGGAILIILILILILR